MMEQYLKIKENYQDTILFFRMGDFYEMFLDDAVIASKELDLALTSRDGKRKDENGNKIKEDGNIMCGIPYHAAEGYIAKLISKGYKVAICEQLEDPALAKGIVKRDVIRVITPGTVFEGSLLDEKSNNYLCSVYKNDNRFGLAFCDISTGEVAVTSLSASSELNLMNEIARYNPTEIIVCSEIFDDAELSGAIKDRFSCLFERAKTEPDFISSEHMTLSQFGADKLSNLGLPNDDEIINALGMLLLYLESTQKTLVGHLKDVVCYSSGEYMDIDVFTRRNLELCETMRSKNKKGSLLWVLDETNTSMGGRMLKSFIEKPLVNCTQIQKRLFAVKELFENQQIRMSVDELTKGITDIERLIGKIVCKSANARDMVALKKALINLPELELELYKLNSPLFKEQCGSFDCLSDVMELLEASIVDEDTPISLKDGGIIKKGYDCEIDELRELSKNSKSAIAKIEAEEKEKTGIKTLKIGYNRVFGYYIEVSKSFKDSVPETYIRKQTLANGERYITEELKELEQKVLGAEDRKKEREYSLFCEIRDTVAKEVRRIQKTAQVIALLDVLDGFARVAVRYNYSMPYVDMSDKIEIKDGRHPVVEKMLKDTIFVPNDTILNCTSDRLLIITGPNMAGKSTYMRQVAIICLMAQIGSFVPAGSCHIGICDKIFTRVGASDDLSAGQSTFMVEMTEVSNILKNATQRSLIILDEIGRGTSTYDGLSIAWAVSEYVADKKKIGARTLFATHYHELTELENKLDGVKNYCIACKKRGDDITFLRRIIKGGADDSYGIEVAALAGLPQRVVRRAKEILSQIDKKDARPVEEKEIPDMQMGLEDLVGSEIADEIGKLDLSTFTPIEALNKLYEMQKKIK